MDHGGSTGGIESLFTFRYADLPSMRLRFLGCCDGTKSDVVSPLSMVEEWQSEQVRSFLLVWCPSRFYGVCKESSRNKRLYQSFGLCYE